MLDPCERFLLTRGYNQSPPQSKQPAGDLPDSDPIGKHQTNLNYWAGTESAPGDRTFSYSGVRLRLIAPESPIFLTEPCGYKHVLCCNPAHENTTRPLHRFYSRNAIFCFAALGHLRWRWWRRWRWYGVGRFGARGLLRTVESQGAQRPTAERTRTLLVPGFKGRVGEIQSSRIAYPFPLRRSNVYPWSWPILLILMHQT
jgi:hypothetical protein